MASMEEERRQRQERADERRAERKTRNDDIRRKYGLVRDETPPYTRFDQWFFSFKQHSTMEWPLHYELYIGQSDLPYKPGTLEV